jgi:hypothetical protein
VPEARVIHVRRGKVRLVLFRDRSKVRWSDVAGFSRWTVNRAHVVGYSYVFGYTGKRTSRTLSAALGAPDGTLASIRQSAAFIGGGR